MNITFPLLHCSTIDAEFGFSSCGRKLTLTDSWTRTSCRMKAEDGIPALETALSLTSSAEEYMAVLLRNIDSLYGHYSRPYLRKWRFRRQCARQSALSNICNELLSGRADVVTNFTTSDIGRKTAARERR